MRTQQELSLALDEAIAAQQESNKGHVRVPCWSAQEAHAMSDVARGQGHEANADGLDVLVYVKADVE